MNTVPAKACAKRQQASKLLSGVTRTETGALLSATKDQIADHSFLPREPDTCTREHAPYDMNNPIGDGNTGWMCYDRIRTLSEFSYDRSQGICHTPRGNLRNMWRHKTYDFCKTECDHDANCKSFLFAEGQRHMYTGTCETYDA